MSRIYFDRHSKQEFITYVKNKRTDIQQLILIKKYHKYESALVWFPKVLSDIIMSYINDIIIMRFRLHTSIYEGLVFESP